MKRLPRRAPVAARPELGDGGNMRPVVDLLVEQVRCRSQAGLQQDCVVSIACHACMP